jgi:hypothetical protein
LWKIHGDITGSQRVEAIEVPFHKGLKQRETELSAISGNGEDGSAVTIDNSIQEEIKGTSNYGNVCHYSVTIISSFLPL